MARIRIALLGRIERGLAVVLICVATTTALVHAQCVIEENQPIIGSDTGSGDQFGSSVAMSGELAVVGAPFDATERGSVYVFRLENGLWVQEQKLMALDPDTFGYFGASVDIDGDTLIVGAPDNDFFVGPLFVEDAGEAEVFRRIAPGDWVREATLQASNTAEMREFGQSVALEGEVAVISADRAFPQLSDPSAGAAYVFRRDDSTWIEETILLPSTGTAKTTSEVESLSRVRRSLFPRALTIMCSEMVLERSTFMVWKTLNGLSRHL